MKLHLFLTLLLSILAGTMYMDHIDSQNCQKNAEIAREIAEDHQRMIYQMPTDRKDYEDSQEEIRMLEKDRERYQNLYEQLNIDCENKRKYKGYSE